MFNKLFKKQTKKENFVHNFNYKLTPELTEYLENGSITIPKMFNHFVDLDDIYTACAYLKKYPELNKKRSLDRDVDYYNIVLHVFLDDYKDVFLCTNYRTFSDIYNDYKQLIAKLQSVIKED